MKTRMIGNEYKSIRRGVRQGYVLSPGPFNIYSGVILREICDLEGIKVGMRYAVVTVLIADSREKTSKQKCTIFKK